MTPDSTSSTQAQTVKVEVDFSGTKRDARFELAWNLCRALQDVFDKARTNGDLFELADVCIKHREDVAEIVKSGSPR